MKRTKLFDIVIAVKCISPLDAPIIGTCSNDILLKYELKINPQI